MIQSFKLAFIGQEKLWKVFWMWGFVGSFAISFLLFLLMMLSEMVSLGSIGRIAVSLIFVAYFIWLAVAIWRCAFNAHWKIWGYVARAFLALQIILMVIAVWKGVTGELQAPISKHAISEQVQSPEAVSNPYSTMVPDTEVAVESTESYVRCKEKMEAHAIGNNVDPQLYVSQNIGWLNDCAKKTMNK
jgi:hypothetical protein